jgi:hypothetical protein
MASRIAIAFCALIIVLLFTHVSADLISFLKELNSRSFALSSSASSFIAEAQITPVVGATKSISAEPLAIEFTIDSIMNRGAQLTPEPSMTISPTTKSHHQLIFCCDCNSLHATTRNDRTVVGKDARLFSQNEE